MANNSELPRPAKVPRTMSTLGKEIRGLGETLVLIDRGFTRPQDTIKRHAERIHKLMLTHSEESCTSGVFPIHALLSVCPLMDLEIPLNVLEMLAPPFDLNQYDSYGMTCLNLAIYNRHFNAVRWLVQHGADCNQCPIQNSIDKICETRIGLTDTTFRQVLYRKKSPIVLLASMDDVPLDLFHVLKTEQNINSNTLESLPLHTAVEFGKFTNVRPLLEIGASVDRCDKFTRLPIDHYLASLLPGKVNQHTLYNEKLFDEELLVSITPTGSKDIFKTTCSILGKEFSGFYNLPKILRQLLQQLVFDPGYVEIEVYHFIYAHIRLTVGEDSSKKSFTGFQHCYLISLLLSLMDTEMVHCPAKIERRLYQDFWKSSRKHVRAINGIWKIYRRQNPKVKSLEKLCIKSVRKHMTKRNDSSFMSLQIPALLRPSLMYHDIADKVSEAWRLWPECKDISH